MTIEDLIGIFPDMDNGKYLPDGHVQYMAACPCHPDRYESLSIQVKLNNEGQVNGLKLLCHAGCSPKEIVAAAGIPNPEEMFEKTDIQGRKDCAGRAVTSAKDVARTAEMVPVAAAQEIVVHNAAAEAVKEMAAAMSGQIGAMAEMLRVSNDRMAAMEEEMRGLREAVRTLEKVTPAQAATVNRLIQQRALDLCEEYRIGACADPRMESGKKGPGRPGISREAKALGAMIRADVRTLTGTRTVREIARCDWETAVDYITGWDDYDKIMTIKAAQKKRGVQA